MRWPYIYVSRHAYIDNIDEFQGFESEAPFIIRRLWLPKETMDRQTRGILGSASAWAPALTCLSDGLWSGHISQINPFLLKLFSATVCITATKSWLGQPGYPECIAHGWSFREKVQFSQYLLQVFDSQHPNQQASLSSWQPEGPQRSTDETHDYPEDCRVSLWNWMHWDTETDQYN